VDLHHVLVHQDALLYQQNKYTSARALMVARPTEKLSRGRHVDMTLVERERIFLLPDSKNGTIIARRLQRDVRRQLSDLLA
jgi:hypothetical protein